MFHFTKKKKRKKKEKHFVQMAIDKLGCYKKKQHRREYPRSRDPYLSLLVKLYKFLSRRTSGGFNAQVLKRLMQSKHNRPVLSLSRLTVFMRNRMDKTAVVVSTVVDDPRLLDVPKMSVCALRFTNSARARITKAGGECITLDQLALRTPTGSNTVLLSGCRTHRKAFAYFGPPPGARGSHTKPRCPKPTKMGRKYEQGRGRH